jgi:hypothetical protein
MNRLLLIISLIICSGIAAQEEVDFYYNEYEITSKAEFELEHWQATISAVDNAFINGLDYPELHYRKGIANYYIGNYKAALPDLLSYHASNKRDPYIQIYIYYAYIFSGLYIEAKEFIQKKHNYAKYKVVYQPPSIIKDINIEAGTKLSDNPSEIGPLVYFNFSTVHEIDHGLSINTQYSNLKQPNYWGGYNQNHYLLGARKYIGNKLTAKANFQAFSMKANIFLKTNDTTYLEDFPNSISYTTDTLIANKSGNGINISFGLERYFKDMNIGVFANLYSYGTTENQTYASYIAFTDSFSISDSTITESKNSFQLGTDIKWYPSFMGQQFTLGVNAFMLKHRDSSLFIFKPSVFYMITNKLSIYGDYMKIGTTDFAENDGTIIQNGLDISAYRTNFAIAYQVSKELNVYVLYQREKKQENYLKWDYNYNSFIIGIKMNL